VTPGRGEPSLDRTVPEIEPVVSAANAAPAVRRTRSASQRKRWGLLNIVFLLSEGKKGL
jgi:hypothetical protein